MKRIFKALSAFALSLAFTLALAATPVSAAENSLSGPSDGNYAGYLVILHDRPTTYSADPFAAATLMAASDERDELLMLAEDWNIYKAGSMSDIQSLVYAGQVALVEPDYQAELFDVTPVEPDDPYLNQNKQNNLVGEYGVGIRAAWEAGLTGEGVTVAVVDSGLNGAHEDVPLKVGRGRYFYYREDPEEGRYELEVNGVRKLYSYWSSGNWTDSMGHGSMVAGIIAAPTGNGIGVASMAPGVTILPIRCFTTTPGHVGGYTSNLISGINFAVANGADIINMSWGVKQFSATLQAAVDAASRAGCILIAAAGNDGKSDPQYPAAWDNVISVGATDNLGNLCSYSQKVGSVNVCAPGGSTRNEIYSLGHGDSDNYLARTGTSFSAPEVSAAAALLKQADPSLTQGDFTALLRQTSIPLTNANSRPYSGWGRLNLQGLLDKVGYAGCSAQTTEDGVSVYAGYHPVRESGIPGVVTVVAGYNAQGHLVDSRVSAPDISRYNNYAGRFTFTDPTITEFRTFFLRSDTLAALCEPIIPLLDE